MSSAAFSPLTGKVAIVTGANRGIGLAIARQLAAAGARVVLTARDAALLSTACQMIEGSASLPLDLRLPDAPAQLVEFALQQFQRIDILVNNAGATKRGEFLELTDDDWLDGYSLKLFGAVRLTRAAWPHLRESGSGSVVNIAGIGGRTPGAQFTIGGSVNAALLSLTKALADAGLRDGVQVNAINPGTIRTARFDKRLATFAAAHNIDITEAEQQFVEAEKVTRIGEPEDVASLVGYLVSPAGRFLHGSIIDADGGATKSL